MSHQQHHANHRGQPGRPEHEQHAEQPLPPPCPRGIRNTAARRGRPWRRRRQEGRRTARARRRQSISTDPRRERGLAHVDHGHPEREPQALGAKGVRSAGIPLPCARMSTPRSRPSSRLPETDPSRYPSATLAASSIMAAAVRSPELRSPACPDRRASRSRRRFPPARCDQCHGPGRAGRPARARRHRRNHSVRRSTGNGAPDSAGARWRRRTAPAGCCAPTTRPSG